MLPHVLAGNVPWECDSSSTRMTSPTRPMLLAHPRRFVYWSIHAPNGPGATYDKQPGLVYQSGPVRTTRNDVVRCPILDRSGRKDCHRDRLSKLFGTRMCKVQSPVAKIMVKKYPQLYECFPPMWPDAKFMHSYVCGSILTPSQRVICRWRVVFSTRFWAARHFRIAATLSPNRASLLR